MLGQGFVDGPDLDCNTLYVFKMTLNAGNIWFEVYKNYVSSSNRVFIACEYTGQTHFIIDNGFSVWEEVWYDGASYIPPYNYKFQNTYVDGQRFDQWVKFYSGAVPGSVTIIVSSYYHYVYIQNHVGGGGGDLPF